MKRPILWVPLIAFVMFAGFAAIRMSQPGDSKHESKMVGKPLPAFALIQGASDRPALSSGDFNGKPRLLNVFASWCIPCVAEIPVLNELAARGVIIEGIAIRDKRADVDAFLAKNGNPYRAIGMDPTSSIQMAIGSSGVPETFVIDGNGIIRHQHIGDIRSDDIPDILKRLEAAK